MYLGLHSEQGRASWLFSDLVFQFPYLYCCKHFKARNSSTDCFLFVYILLLSVLTGSFYMFISALHIISGGPPDLADMIIFPKTIVFSLSYQYAIIWTNSIIYDLSPFVGIYYSLTLPYTLCSHSPLPITAILGVECGSFGGMSCRQMFIVAGTCTFLIPMALLYILNFT